MPEKYYGQRSVVGYSPRSCKALDTAECTHTHELWKVTRKSLVKRVRFALQIEVVVVKHLPMEEM